MKGIEKKKSHCLSIQEAQPQEPKDEKSQTGTQIRKYSVINVTPDAYRRCYGNTKEEHSSVNVEEG